MKTRSGSRTKRFLSLVLTLAMLLSLFSMGAVPAAAADEEPLPTEQTENRPSTAEGGEAAPAEDGQQPAPPEDGEQNDASDDNADAKDGDVKDGDVKDGDVKDGDVKDGDVKDGKDGEEKKDGDVKDPEDKKDEIVLRDDMTVASANGVELSVSGKLPEGAIVVAEPMRSRGGAKAPARSGAKGGAKSGEDSLAELITAGAIATYDITIYADDARRELGESWQPEAPVTVTLTNAAFEDYAYVDVYHMGALGAELVASAVPVVKGTISFPASSFSVYAVTPTPPT